ncbi:MAG: hypothetical protein ACI8Z1_000291 [Candidatus Azotimanducaceae bacterium]|jgi:hypothetical protein
MKPPVLARIRHRMMVLALTFNVIAPAWCIAATSDSDSGPSESSAPTLELLEYLGLMVESEEGELIGPGNLGEDLSEPPTQSDGVDREQWISLDSPYSAGESTERSYSSDNLFLREETDE